MKIIDSDINSLDLNLLRVLDMVLREGGATGAARRLHVTQSAVSNSLARLRDMFGDPLVIREGKGLSPTPMARRLMPLLSQALDQLESAVKSQVVFDPLLTRRRFTLASAASRWPAPTPITSMTSPASPGASPERCPRRSCASSRPTTWNPPAAWLPATSMPH